MTSAAATVWMIQSLQAHGVSDDDIPETVIASELHDKGLSVPDIAKAMHKRPERIARLLGVPHHV